MPYTKTKKNEPLISLNRKDRVLRAIDHQPVDRVPKGELCLSDNIIKYFLNISEVSHPDRREFAEQTGMDLVCLSPFYRDTQTPFPCPAPDRADWPDLERWAKETDFFPLILLDGAFAWGVKHWGFEKYILKLMRKDPEVFTLNGEIESFNAELARKAAEKGAAAVVLAEDIAYKNGLIATPEMLRNYIFPSLERQTENFKALGLYVFFHSDGDLNLILEDIVDIGFDGLQCIEEAAGMDLFQVKQRYGNKICLWGNLDPVFLDETAAPGPVEEKIQDIMSAAGRESGFIFGTSSGLFHGLSPERIYRAYRAAEQTLPEL